MLGMVQYLEANGVQRIDPTLGEKLDPNKHEAVYQVSDPTKEPGTIAAVLKVCSFAHQTTQRRKNDALMLILNGG